MDYDYSKLRGRIRERFGTQDNFAKAMEMSFSTLSLKLNNKAEWTQDEMRRACRLLEINENNIITYFFTHEV